MSDDTVEELRRDFDAAWRLSPLPVAEVTRCNLADTTMLFLDRARSASSAYRFAAGPRAA
jgi:hypothetical protein